MAKRNGRFHNNNNNNNNTNNNKKRKKKKQPIPVTILSGFLGSGKTTLMRHILTSMDHGLKIAVIVNDMAELDIDGQTIQKSAVKNTKTVVTLPNGCICCNLRGDLIREIHRIQQLGQFDYVLIESTGIAEPQQVAESFCVDPETMKLVADENVTGQMLLEAAQLDTCVTVVDAVEFPKYLSSLDKFKDIFSDGLESQGEEEGEKSISQLMMEQVEFANVIVLNKIDMVTPQQLNTSRAIIHKLNPTAKILTASYGKIDVQTILNTGLFDMEEASESPGWLLSIIEHGVSGAPGEADEYGVSSFVYRNRSPFHPKRLHSFLSKFFWFADQWNNDSTHNNKDRKELDQKYGRILRSKGNCWLAGRDSHMYDWAQAGQIVALEPGQPWYCTLPPEDWGSPLSDEDKEAIEESFYQQDKESGNKIPHDFGDRKSVVVLIGTELKQEALTKALNDCCLTKEELRAHTTDLPYGSYEDPLLANLVECDGVKSLFMVARHGQNQHLHVTRGCSLTLQNLSLVTHDESIQYKVRVWLDKTDFSQRGVLLATLRPDSYEQHSMSMTILPCDVDGGEADSNRRLRIEVVLPKNSKVDKMELCEVHVVGSVEPLPFADDQEEQDAMTDEEPEDSDTWEEETGMEQ